MLINGGPIGPDGLGGAYRNTDSDDRAALWAAHKARQGIVAGGTVSTRAGELAVDVAALSAFIAERDASGNVLERGYHAWSDTATTLVFDPPSASARNDAVVLAVADTSAGSGAFGTGITEAGPQLVIVPGVSGVATPRTDSDIQGFVGGGGWLRLADATINPGDTEVAAASLAAAETWSNDSGWIDLTPYLVNSWTVRDGSPAFRALNGVVYMRGRANIPNGSTNYRIAIIPAAFAPEETLYVSAPAGQGYGRLQIDPDGSIWADSASTAQGLDYQSLAVSWPLG